MMSYNGLIVSDEYWYILCLREQLLKEMDSVSFPLDFPDSNKSFFEPPKGIKENSPLDSKKVYTRAEEFFLRVERLKQIEEIYNSKAFQLPTSKIKVVSEGYF